MALEIGEIYVPASAEEIRDDFLTDIRLEAIKQGVANPPVLPGSDWHVLGTALANIALIQYSNLRISSDNSNVLTATGQDLDSIREAYGLPQVPASPATGKLIVSVVGALPITIAGGTEFVLPNGLRGQVDGIHINVFNGDEVSVVTIDTGNDANLEANTIVSFVAPPINLETEARVSVNDPLTGGSDEETDERKRARILNRLQTVPAGGNWGDLIETSLNALATLQYAFVYPALGGPGSCKVVLCKSQDPDNDDFSRRMTSAAVNIIRSAIFNKMPSPMEIVVQSVAEESFDASLTVEVPNAATSGGNGQGWIDQAPWPPLVVADGGRCVVGPVLLPGSQVYVTANTAVSPIAGQTHIAWWSSVDQRFYTRLVTAVSGASPAWTLTLDAPLVDSKNNSPLAGEFISPAAVNMENYGNTWRSITNRLGPGENTSDANRIPRSKRHPFEDDGDWYSSLTIQQLKSMAINHPEIIDVSWSYRSTISPTVPALVSTAPNVLLPRHFGIYKA